jgi:hypothetical protein
LQIPNFQLTRFELRAVRDHREDDRITRDDRLLKKIAENTIKTRSFFMMSFALEKPYGLHQPVVSFLDFEPCLFLALEMRESRH